MSTIGAISNKGFKRYDTRLIPAIVGFK